MATIFFSSAPLAALRISPSATGGGDDNEIVEGTRFGILGEVGDDLIDETVLGAAMQIGRGHGRTGCR